MLLALCISGAMAQNPTLSSVTAAPETDETQLFIQQFHRILNQVINDYPNRFKNIITGPVSEEESDVFLVSAALPEADRVTVSTRMARDLSSVQHVFTAVFFEGDEETARLIFENVEYLIMICPFACCEIAYDNLDSGMAMEETSTIWMSVDENNPDYEEMLIQLRIYKTISFTDEGTVHPWTVVLNISPLW